MFSFVIFMVDFFLKTPPKDPFALPHSSRSFSIRSTRPESLEMHTMMDVPPVAIGASRDPQRTYQQFFGSGRLS